MEVLGIRIANLIRDGCHCVISIFFLLGVAIQAKAFQCVMVIRTIMDKKRGSNCNKPFQQTILSLVWHTAASKLDRQMAAQAQLAFCLGIFIFIFYPSSSALHLSHISRWSAWLSWGRKKGTEFHLTSGHAGSVEQWTGMHTVMNCLHKQLVP